MNIFVTSKCPIESADNLCNKRTIKMILESAQMLSTAIRLTLDSSLYDDKILYKATHQNHPCSLWVRESYENFIWLCRHAKQMNKNYRSISGKDHKSMDIIHYCERLSGRINYSIITPFTNCTKDFKNEINVHDAYKKQMCKKWSEDKTPPKFTYSGKTPEFWSNYLEELEIQ